MRARFVVTTALLFASAACTHDFDAFQASGDGGHVDAATNDSANDASQDTPSIDTTAEASCTPQETCLVDAQTCAAPCDTAETSCVSGCGNPGCKSKCHDTANACRATCATACVTCTTNAGCAAPTQCTAAAK